MTEEDDGRIYKKDKRTFLKSDKEKKKSKEETDKCEICGSPDEHWAFNCGKDCIYHEQRKDELHEIEDDLKPCKCTNENKAGFIENRDYCTFKRTKRADLDIEDIDIMTMEWIYV